MVHFKNQDTDTLPSLGTHCETHRGLQKGWATGVIRAGAPPNLRSSSKSKLVRQSGKHLLALSLSDFDPGCVKTCTSQECAELFSLSSSLSSGRKRFWFSNLRNRDGISTRRLNVGVFTRPRPEADISGLILIIPDNASIAANVNDNCVFPLFAARFGCHHPREMTGGPPCAGVSRSGRCLLRGR